MSMREYHTPLDAHNPGQFLACCGLFELAELANGGGTAWFNERPFEFVLQTETNMPLSFGLEDANLDIDDPTLETLTLLAPTWQFVLNWWRNETQTDKSQLKTWGGQQTPRRVLGELLRLVDFSCPFEKLFDSAVYTKSRFGVDARSAWEAIDTGYSPNDENQAARTYPWVEILAVIGLEGFRPAPSDKKKFHRRYSAWLEPLTLTSARAAAACPWNGLETRDYEFEIAPRGQGYKTFLSAKGADHERNFDAL
jgi:CRISPR-associated protein Csx14